MKTSFQTDARPHDLDQLMAILAILTGVFTAAFADSYAARTCGFVIAFTLAGVALFIAIQPLFVRRAHPPRAIPEAAWLKARQGERPCCIEVRSYDADLIHEGRWIQGTQLTMRWYSGADWIVMRNVSVVDGVVVLG
ncbi:hypothetical protein [uncultured Variovorax sp.]|uniref:hypothetical protein n=1 Tax=uncultured Variovorax sp. TaxID=114708 RepID=UPI0026248428|nr:hypothetical protein [uncultured Variovorax sp.]